MDNLFVLHPNIRENIHVGKWDFFYEQISCGKFSAQVRSAEFSDSFLMVEEDGFVAQLKRRVSYPYPRRTYAIATVSGVPSWVNRLSKAART